ncbi:DUF945 family protein [Marinobacter sp.]|uniref:DUF945 family protein n=1 Tax=Marinobacter sp. TaxID=50741 RepID=UPI0035645292
MTLNKWTIAGTAILLVAGVAPWGVGYVTEQQWLQATEEINGAQPFVRMETNRYQRGILSAEATGTLTIFDPKTGDSHSLDFQVAISHGVVGSFLDFRPSQGWQSEGNTWFEGPDPALTLETRLWGSAALEFQAPPVVINSPDRAESFRASGGLARIDIGHLGERADILLVWPEMTMSGPDLDITAEDFHFEQSLSWLTADIWTGSGTMTLGALTLESPDEPSLLVKGISFDTSSVASNGDQTLSSEAVLEIETVRFAENAYGPHRIAVAVDGVDVASWNDFSSAMADMQTLALGTDLRPGYEQQMAAMQRFNDAIRGLAGKGFSVGVRELNLNTPEGKVQGSLDISHPALSEEDRANMLMVMQQLVGTVDFSMPLALAENYPAVRMQVAPLIKQGLLVQEGDQLVMTGRMKDVALDINGLQIPLPPLL